MSRLLTYAGSLMAVLLLLFSYRVLRIGSASRFDKWVLILSSLAVVAIGAIALLSSMS